MNRISGGLTAAALKPMQSLKGMFTRLHNNTVTFMEAMQDIEAANIIPDILPTAEVNLQTAKDAKSPAGDLENDAMPVDGVAALYEYSAEDTDPPLYQVMNEKCYLPDRKLIKPFVKLMWLILKSMMAIEPYPEPAVFRGVKQDLSSQYPEGKEFTWHGFCSCTTSLSVLENEQFCGKSGKRTLFFITLTQGQARCIKRYSLMAHEDEVLLPPGCRFKVKTKMDQDDGLTIIHLEEQPSHAWIINLGPASAPASAPAAAPAPDPVGGPAPKRPRFTAAPYGTYQGEQVIGGSWGFQGRLRLKFTFHANGTFDYWQQMVVTSVWGINAEKTVQYPGSYSMNDDKLKFDDTSKFIQELAVYRKWAPAPADYVCRIVNIVPCFVSTEHLTLSYDIDYQGSTTDSYTTSCKR